MGLRSLASKAALLAVPPLGLTYAFESVVRHNVFYSGPYERGVPEAIGVPFEEHTFWTADGQELTGWLFEGGPLPATVLFMHGTSYNASDMWQTEDRAQRFGGFLRGLGCRFFVFDYRGYGQNTGTPSEQHSYLDAEGALAYLHNQRGIDAAQIVFYGFSLGSGVAVELAVRDYPCAGLILRAPFTSIRELIVRGYPRLRALLSLMPWLPITRYDSESKIGHIRAPLLIMHGDGDERVPQSMGSRLFELAPEPKRFVSLPDAGHADFPLELMVPAIRGFLDETTGVRHSEAPA
jgi:fermentation-respiration switch protein FrsA (DUF1100 family)